jgi:hypothetical protein
MDEKFVHEIPITIDFRVLKEKYKKMSINDPMLYYSYQIKQGDEIFYSQFMDHKFDFTQYDYYLECDND